LERGKLSMRKKFVFNHLSKSEIPSILTQGTIVPCSSTYKFVFSKQKKDISDESFPSNKFQEEWKSSSLYETEKVKEHTRHNILKHKIMLKVGACEGNCEMLLKIVEDFIGFIPKYLLS